MLSAWQLERGSPESQGRWEQLGEQPEPQEQRGQLLEQAEPEKREQWQGTGQKVEQQLLQ